MSVAINVSATVALEVVTATLADLVPTTPTSSMLASTTSTILHTFISIVPTPYVLTLPLDVQPSTPSASTMATVLSDNGHQSPDENLTTINPAWWDQPAAKVAMLACLMITFFSIISLFWLYGQGYIDARGKWLRTPRLFRRSHGFRDAYPAPLEPLPDVTQHGSETLQHRHVVHASYVAGAPPSPVTGPRAYGGGRRADLEMAMSHSNRGGADEAEQGRGSWRVQSELMRLGIV